MSNIHVYFIPKVEENPKTGGEIYNKKMVSFLQTKYYVRNFSFDFLRIKAQSSIKVLLFAVFAIIRNMLYILHITFNSKQTLVVFEDIYFSTDLFIFNYVVHMLNRKNIIIIPIVHHFYSDTRESKVQKSIFNKIEKIFISNSTYIICNSDYNKNAILSIDKSKRENVFIIHPGVETKNQGISRRKEKENVNLLYMGSIIRRKDILTLLKSITLLDSNIYLHVVGNTKKEIDYMHNVLDFIENNNLEKRVFIHGFMAQEKLDELYRIIDIFVFPSLYEGFGMVTIEAMQNGFPVVATDIEATRELITHEFNGLLVPPQNPVEMAKSINRLIFEEDLKEKLVQNGYMTSAKYSWESGFATLRGIIDRIDQKSKLKQVKLH